MKVARDSKVAEIRKWSVINSDGENFVSFLRRKIL